MFKALQKQTGEEILLLEPKWLKEIKELRALDKADLLVCQGCLQPVRVRVPRYRRTHFAHKHLANCTFGAVSPELLQAQVHWVFLRSMLHEDPGKPGTIYLTTTERAFVQPSEHDAAKETMGQAVQGSLHYLDPETGLLTTFRGLRLAHAPQVFTGRKEATAALAGSRRAAVRGAESSSTRGRRRACGVTARNKASASGRKLAAWSVCRRSNPAWPARRSPSQPDQIPDPTRAPAEPRQPFARQAICLICGETTTDWVTYYGGTGKCICRKCSSI